MIYFKTLPHIDNIRWLAKIAGPYPASRQTIEAVARDWNFSDNSIEFLRLFPKDEEFASQEDFLTRCEEVEILIRQEREAPAEVLHSPED